MEGRCDSDKMQLQLFILSDLVSLKLERQYNRGMVQLRQCSRSCSFSLAWHLLNKKGGAMEGRCNSNNIVIANYSL